VPLPDGTFAVGVVARRTPRGEVLLAYFFGPRRPDAPEEVPDGLQAEDALLVRRVFPFGFDDGSWPVLGAVPGFDRAAWPMPDLIRGPDTDGGFWRERYDDREPDELLASEPATDDDRARLPPEAVYEDGALAGELDEALR
jgi:hypothetical protein